MSLGSKRYRTPSQSSSLSSGSTLDARNPSKASRTTPALGSVSDVATAHPLLCTLPPTCNHKPTPIASTGDLEIHYAKYHAHVCEEGGCGAVFPDGRLLELHQTECHDPLAAVRKDRGDKIFACHLASCPRLFSTPKTRRLHLIQAHAFPKEYFFAVTNKGVGGLLRRWGEGASMIRGEWKARDEKRNGEEDDEGGGRGDRDEDQERYRDVDGDGDSSGDGGETDHYSNSEVSEDGDGDSHDQIHELSKDQREKKNGRETHTNNDDDSVLDGLTNTMGSLTLVPPSIRFGRGGKNGGFAHNGRGGGHVVDGGAGGRRGRGKGGGAGARGAFHSSHRGRGVNATQSPAVMDIDTVAQSAQSPVSAIADAKNARQRSEPQSTERGQQALGRNRSVSRSKARTRARARARARAMTNEGVV